MVAAKRRRNTVAADMPAIGDDMAAAGEDVAHRTVAGGKDPGVDELIALAADERGMRVVEDDDVGGLADGERSGSEAQRLGAAAARGVEQVPAGRGADGAEPVALPLAQALAVFQRAQLLVEGDAHVAVGADGEAAAGGGKARRLEDAVAEIGLGDRAQAGNGAGCARRALSSGVMCVQWIRHQRASTCMLSSSHCTGRAPDQATHSSTSRICSAAWMWMGPAGPALDQRAQLGGIDGAQRMRRDAERGAVEPGDVAPARLDQPREAVEVGQEARLPRRGRLAAAAAVGIEGRQQRQADAARLGRGDDAAAGLGRDRRSACRRARCAGSGTRRRVVKPDSSIST